MKKYVVSALIIFPFVAYAQSANLDSLLIVLSKAKEDSSKVLLYIDIGNAYEYDNPKKAGEYYQLAGALSRRLDYKVGIIKYISNYTGILNVKGELDSSLMLNQQAVQIAKELNDNLYLAKTSANVGNSFNFLGQNDSAQYYYETAIKYFEKTNNPYFIARMEDLLQNVCFKMRQDEKGVKHGRNAVRYFRANNKEWELGQALLNLANNYQPLNADSALLCYKEAYAISQKIGFKQLELSTLVGIGNNYFHRYDANSMQPNYEAALQLSSEIDNPEGEVIAGRGMSLCYLLRKDFVTAEKYILSSLKIADSLNMQMEKLEGLKVMSSILFALHDTKSAEKYLDSASVIENKFRGEEIQNKTLLFEKRFETEKKEAQIELQKAQLEQKNIVNYILIGSTVSLLIISLLIYRNYQQRQRLQQQRINELETEKQLTATEAILKGEEQERSRLAKDLHDGLGGMLSGIKYSLNNMKENMIMVPADVQAFEHSIHLLDNSISEMRRVAHNLMPESLLKFGLDEAVKDFCKEMGRNGVLKVVYQSFGLKDKSIDRSLSVTIYRIVQELLNNIVKHAHATQAIVQLSASENQLTITVEDDGKGMEADVLKTAQGIGWKNIRSRVDYHKGTINMQSTPRKGTSIFIEFPTA